MKRKKKKLNLYEVYIPMPYCEVHRVKAASKKEVQKIIDNHEIHNVGECIGEVASRRKKIIKIQGG